MNFDHISTAEIQQDIADTLAEIKAMEREEQGLRLIGDRMSVFRADARRSGIQERIAFIKKLEAILISRVAPSKEGEK